MQVCQKTPRVTTREHFLATLGILLQVSVRICTETTQALCARLKEAGEPTNVIRLFGNLRPQPLCWGECIPLWFIQKALKDKGDAARLFGERVLNGGGPSASPFSLIQAPLLFFSGNSQKTSFLGGLACYSLKWKPQDAANLNVGDFEALHVLRRKVFFHARCSNKQFADVKYVIMNSPGLRAIDQISESAKRRGRALADFIQNDKRRILMLCSGDLSHMHQYDCTESWYTPCASSSLYVALFALL